jgi:hypothetical protein
VDYKPGLRGEVGAAAWRDVRYKHVLLVAVNAFRGKLVRSMHGGDLGDLGSSVMMIG